MESGSFLGSDPIAADGAALFCLERLPTLLHLGSVNPSA